MESDGKNMSKVSWEFLPDETYDKVLKNMKDDLKRYLGYPPHNVAENKCKRNPEFLKTLQIRYGRTLPELLERTGMDDLGDTAPPKTTHMPTSSMLKAIKRIYGIENLIFGLDYTGWKCSTKPSDIEGMRFDYGEFERLIKVLDGQIKLKNRLPNLGKVLFLDTGNEHLTLDSLREELLVIKLSGLLHENIR